MLDRNESYVFGLLITDGSLSLYDRNRGRVQLELGEKDIDIIEKLVNLIPGSKIKTRERITNFTSNKTFKSVIFVNSHLDFRTKLINWGYPIKDKTLSASIPSVEFHEIDFWRGVIDGDGSLGLTGTGLPFISLVTKSENLKTEYLKFLEKYLNLKKNVSRNKRDSVFNIMSNSGNAVKIAELLYSNNPQIYLERKYKKYLEILDWKNNKQP